MMWRGLCSELDDEFYGFNSEDVEALSAASTASFEDCDEDTGTNAAFYISTAITSGG